MAIHVSSRGTPDNIREENSKNTISNSREYNISVVCRFMSMFSGLP